MKYFVLLLSMVFVGIAHAQPITHSNDVANQTIVLYGANFAGVYEIRELNLEQGLNRIVLSGLPLLHDQSNLEVFLNGRQIEYTAPNPYTNFENYYKTLIGKTITLQSPNDTVTGRVDGYQSGALVLTDEEGRRQIIHGVHNYRLILPDEAPSPFDSVNPSILVYADEAGEQNLGLYYTHNLMGWTAEHRLVVDESTGLLDWTTLGFIRNNTNQAFENSRFILFSGDINLMHGGYNPPIMLRSMAADSAMESDFMPESEQFSDFYRYTYHSNSVLSAGGTLQFTLFEKAEVPFEKKFEHNLSVHGGNRVNIRPEIVWYIDSTETGLNDSLPPGKVRISTKEENNLMILGEQMTGFITPGDELRFRTGRASDITITETKSSRVMQAAGYTEFEVILKVRNNRNESQNLDLRFQRPANSEILEVSHSAVEKGNLNTYIVALNPESETEFRMIIRLHQRRN